MANLPAFGRAWQRFAAIPRPVPTSQPASEPDPTEPEIPATSAPTTKHLQPFEPTPPPAASSPPSSPPRESIPRLSSPSKKAASPSYSPKHKETYTTTTRVASQPIKSARSPPSPAHKRYDGGRRVSPTSSPKTTKPAKTSPPPSPKYRQPAAPLSPLTLPRSEVKPAAGTMTRSRSPPVVEQKSVLYQKTAEKPVKSDRHQEYSSGKPKPTQKQQPEAINITGHNVGAVMEIRESSDKREGGEIIRKKETEGSGYGNDERKTAGKEKSDKANKLPTKAFMNSNFQGVNNSLLYDSTCSHRDPGLHLAFAPTANEDGSIVDGNKDYKR